MLTIFPLYTLLWKNSLDGTGTDCFNSIKKHQDIHY